VGVDDECRDCTGGRPIDPEVGCLCDIWCGADRCGAHPDVIDDLRAALSLAH
jgi:hypothetical protein